MPLRRLLQAATDPSLLEGRLVSFNIDRPLGLLERRPLCEALGLLDEIRVLVQQRSDERRKAKPNGTRMQELADEISAKSSRIYELVPTRNFQHETVGPIDSMMKVKKWQYSLVQTNDIACSARILLGAQARLSTVSPIDYMYRALGVRMDVLGSEDAELQMVERYITRSADGACFLFSGSGARELPKVPEGVVKRPVWQAVMDAKCYGDAACTQELPLIAPAGYTYTQLDDGAGQAAICIKQLYTHTTRLPTQANKQQQFQQVWVPLKSADGSDALVKLSDREAASQISTIYKVGRAKEESGSGSTLLFHGSGVANCLSILKDGLRIQPPGAEFHGAAFGNGVYFANTFAKSRGYCGFHHGVGFMLLCEVQLGKELEGSGDFHGSVVNARMAEARKELGLPADAKVQDHPNLMERYQRHKAEQAAEGIEDVSGTGCDSFHFMSGGAPEATGTVTHPNGTLVPSGPVVSAQGQAVRGSDELIVYDINRVKIRYVLELRSNDDPALVDARIDNGEDVAMLDGAAVQEDLGEPKGDEDAEEDEDEEDEDEDEDEDDE